MTSIDNDCLQRIPDEIVWSILLLSSNNDRYSIHGVASTLSRFYAELWDDEVKRRFFDQIINEPAKCISDLNTLYQLVKYSNFVDRSSERLGTLFSVFSRHIDENVEALLTNSTIDEQLFVDKASHVIEPKILLGDNRRLYRCLLSAGEAIAKGDDPIINEYDTSLMMNIKRKLVILFVSKDYNVASAYSFTLFRSSSNIALDIARISSPVDSFSKDVNLKSVKTLAICSIDDILSMSRCDDTAYDRICLDYFKALDRYLSYVRHRALTSNRGMSSILTPAIEHVGCKLVYLFHRVYGPNVSHYGKALMLSKYGELRFYHEVIVEAML